MLRGTTARTGRRKAFRLRRVDHAPRHALDFLCVVAFLRKTEPFSGKCSQIARRRCAPFAHPCPPRARELYQCASVGARLHAFGCQMATEGTRAGTPRNEAEDVPGDGMQPRAASRFALEIGVSALGGFARRGKAGAGSSNTSGSTSRNATAPDTRRAPSSRHRGARDELLDLIEIRAPRH